MPTYTMYFKQALEHVYGTTMDPDDYVQEYGEVVFKDTTYGRLPLLSDPTPIGLGTYPIFNEGYRPVLNGKIIDQYWNREIGTETIDNFTLMLRRKMDQIMPYYNQLYESQEIEYEALSSMDINSDTSGTMEVQENTHATSVAESDAKSTARAVNSATPQTMLAGNEDYATSAADSNSLSETDSTGTTDSDSANSTQNTGKSRVTGYQGAASDLINKYRNTLISIDTMVLADVQDCFMLLLNNGDSYSQQNGWIY